MVVSVRIFVDIMGKEAFLCNWSGCQAVTREINEMLEVVFGIDPCVVYSAVLPLRLRQEKLHFCERHQAWKSLLCYLISEQNGNMTSDAELLQDKGCWVTIHDPFIEKCDLYRQIVLGLSGFYNFQMPLDNFVRILEGIPASVEFKKEVGKDFDNLIF